MLKKQKAVVGQDVVVIENGRENIDIVEIIHDVELNKLNLDEKAISSLLKHFGGSHDYIAALGVILNSHDRESDNAKKLLEKASERDSQLALSILVSEALAEDNLSNEVIEKIKKLKKSNPTNSLSDYFEAHVHLNNNDIIAAMDSLKLANSKVYFDDYSMKGFQEINEVYAKMGLNELELKMMYLAKPLPQLSVFRDVADKALEEAKRNYEIGLYDVAEEIVGTVDQLGTKLSGSSKFIIYDLVGISIKEMALNHLKQIHENQGQMSKIEEIDKKITVINERRKRMNLVSEMLDKTFKRMNQKDIVRYLNRVYTEGELSAAMDLNHAKVIMLQDTKSNSGIL